MPSSRPGYVGALGTRHSEAARWVITAHFPLDGDICSTHSLYFLISSPCRSFSDSPSLPFSLPSSPWHFFPFSSPCQSLPIFLSLSFSACLPLSAGLAPSLSPYRSLSVPLSLSFFLSLSAFHLLTVLSLPVCLLSPLLPSPHYHSLFSSFALSISFYIPLFLVFSSSGIAYVQGKEKLFCLHVNKILLIKRRGNEFFTKIIWT